MATPPLAEGESIEGTESATPPANAHRCSLCNAPFPDYNLAWKHVRYDHPEVPRGEITSHIVEPVERPAAPPRPVEPRGAGVATNLARRSGGRAPAILLAHWYHLIEGLQHSSLGFYQALEEALAHRDVPDATRVRADYREGGLLSARREYLRITRGAQAVDICAAPFGSGFFVSWWLGEARPGPLGPTLATLAVFVFAIRFLGVVYGGGALVLGFFVVGALISQGEAPWHAYVFAVPYLGLAWERLFRPLTLYRYDTMLMFKAAIHQAVLEVVDTLTEAKGLRRLSEAERKPILRDFFRR